MSFKKIWHSTKRFLARKHVNIPLVIVLIIFGIYWYQNRNNNGYEIVVANTGTVVEEITVSGKAKPASEVDLAFETSGKVAVVAADVGKEVKAGDLLVALDRSELLASLAEARANLAAEEAKLSELRRGSRPEERAITSAKVTSAETAVIDAERNLIDKINDAYTKADDAIYNTADQFFSNSRSNSATLTISVADPEQKVKIVQGRITLEGILTTWVKELAKISSPLTYADKTFTYLTSVKLFLTDLALGVNTLTSANSTEQSTFDAYKAGVFTARTNINTAITNLTAAKEKYQSAVSSLEVARRELGLTDAGNASEEIDAQLARTEQYRAKVASIEAQLAKRIILAPFDGVVTKQDAKVGAIAPAGTVLAALISKGNLEIEANVPEVHIGKVAAGNTVEIIFDAFPGEKFLGQVVRVDPAETIVGGVPNYQIRVVINKDDPRLKSGLTANLLIQTAKRERVITIPRFAVDSRDGKDFVHRLTGSESILVPVKIGLMGTDGMVEVISGLMSGDKVTVSKE